MIFSAFAIKQLFEQYNIQPSKRLGQNFLIDQNILNKIIEAADIQKDDVILEVGPGLGILTFAMAAKAKQVIAVEKDRFIFNILTDLINKSGFKNIELINQDILKFSIFNFQFSNYKIVANIPYYLTSHLIRKFLETENKPKTMLLIIQKEVAQRICAKPPEMSLLSVSVQYYAEPKIISYVSKNSFWPIPKVDSAIINITPKRDTNLRIHANDTNKFFNVIKAGFSSPRKQLATNLSQKLKINREQIESALKNCGLDPKQRAETLNVDNWQQLSLELLGK